MVNWDEAGKTWPQPRPHAARLLRGLLWGQHYCHSNPHCEDGMPGSFELREDMGESPPAGSGGIAAGGRVCVPLPPQALEGLNPPRQARRRTAPRRD